METESRIACRDAHLTEVGEPDAWQAARAIGVSAMEVTVDLDRTCPFLFGSDEPYGIGSTSAFDRLKGDCGLERVAISAFCLHNRLDVRLEDELKLVADTAAAAEAMGVEAIRVDFMPREMKDDLEGFLPIALEAGKRMVELVDGKNVRLGVENHGAINRAEFLHRLFDGVDSAQFGLTLDTANFYWYGYPLSKVYELYAEFAPRVCHTHCKSIRYPSAQQEQHRSIGWEYGEHACPIDEGDIDFRRVCNILNEAGYTGDWCIENEALPRFAMDERGDVLRREVDHLTSIVSKLKGD
jgi:sugar phosphate isomerase/epimerase